MSAKLEKLDSNKAKLSISVSAEDFGKCIDTVYQKQRGKFNIPGFRKGKAPRAIIENFYGKHIFYEDAFEEVFPQSYTEAIKEHDLDVVSRPENVDILNIDADNGVEFTLEVTLKPEVKLGKYEGIKVRKPVYKVSAKEVDAEVDKIRNQNARWVGVERKAKLGDTVVLDYSGSVDGEKFAGGTAEKQSLVLGSNQFIPGFETQVVGMKAGDEKDIDVKFPEEYTPEVAGKDAVFAIKIHEVQEKQLPEADDEFAQDVSEFDTLAEYKKDIKANLKKQADAKSNVEAENQVLEAVAKNAKIDIPAVMVDNQIDNQIQQMSYQLMYQGIKLEDYLQYVGTTMDDLWNSYRESAEAQVKMRLAVEALIEKLGLQPTPEEAEKRMEEMAKEAGKTLQEYKNTLGSEELEYFGDRVAMERVFDYLVEKADVEEMDGAAYDKAKAEEQEKKNKKEAEKGEKPKAADAKKPAAKKTDAKKETPKKTTAKKTVKKDDAAKEAKPKAAAKKKTEGN